MDRRARIERVIAGDLPDRTPVFAWRHFPGDDLRAADFARAIIDFQRAFDWDVCLIAQNASAFVSEYELQSDWTTDAFGSYSITRHGVQRSLDWTLLRPLDPLRGSFGRLLETTRLVAEELNDTVPVLVQLVSPLTQARMLAGDAAIARFLRTEPERLRTGLTVLTENLLRLIDALRRLPVDGICYAADDADYVRWGEAEYEEFGLSADQRVLGAIPPKFALNLLRLPGAAPMFKFAPALPCAVVNWDAVTAEPNLSIGKALIDGAVCGGLHAWDHVQQGTPSVIRNAVRQALHLTGSRRVIISADRPVPLAAPQSNIRAMRESVEGA